MEDLTYKKPLPCKYLELIVEAMKKVKKEFKEIDNARISDNEQTNQDKEKHTYRERVYCYELYHIMRSIQEGYIDSDKFKNIDTTFAINGEIDKRGHDFIINSYNPDFVIHKHGNMNDNLCVVEVKINYSKSGLHKDFNTLSDMINNYKYKYGVFISIGIDINMVVDIINDENEHKSLNQCSDKIFVFSQINRTDTKVDIYRLDDLLKKRGENEYRISQKI